MCTESPLHEANNLLETVDADDETHGEALPPRVPKGPKLPTKCGENWIYSSGSKLIGDRELWTCEPKDEQQEHIEQTLHESCKASKEHGELQTLVLPQLDSA